MMNSLFYLACLRDTVGTNVAFHCRNGKGYSTDIDKAHLYTREEAQRAWDSGREFDPPLSADAVDTLAEWHVDCQNLPTESQIESGCPAYVLYKKGRWDGNDVCWLGLGGRLSCNLKKAVVLHHPGGDEGFVWIPLAVAEAAKRRTFCIDLIDKRRMTQAAGLVTPEHIKKHRRRRSSGKTRFNCPGCGKISWQHNPYDFMSCLDRSCNKFSEVRSYEQ